MEEEKQISSSSVRKVAIDKGYYARRPIQKPPLDADHMALRLNFAENHENHTMHFWKNVIFMDETMLRLHPDDSRKRVRRQKGTRLEPQNVVPSYKYGGKGVMYWGSMSWEGLGPLIEINDPLRGVGYAQLLAQNMPQVLQCMEVRSPYVVDDKCSVHKTNDVNKAKQELGVRDLEFPTYSPDLNIIESLWAKWKDQIRGRAPRTLEDLKRMALEEWANISLDYIRNL